MRTALIIFGIAALLWTPLQGELVDLESIPAKIRAADRAFWAFLVAGVALLATGLGWPLLEGAFS